MGRGACHGPSVKMAFEQETETKRSSGKSIGDCVLSTSGQALVEFALVLPVLLLVVLGIIRIGNVYGKYQTLTSATAQAARTEAICNTGTQDANTVGMTAATTVPGASFTFTNSAGAAVSHAPSCNIISGTSIKVSGSASADIVKFYGFTLAFPLGSSVTVIEE